MEMVGGVGWIDGKDDGVNGVGWMDVESGGMGVSVVVSVVCSWHI